MHTNLTNPSVVIQSYSRVNCYVDCVQTRPAFCLHSDEIIFYSGVSVFGCGKIDWSTQARIERIFPSSRIQIKSTVSVTSLCLVALSGKHLRTSLVFINSISRLLRATPNQASYVHQREQLFTKEKVRLPVDDD